MWRKLHSGKSPIHIFSISQLLNFLSFKKIVVTYISVRNFTVVVNGIYFYMMAQFKAASPGPSEIHLTKK